MNWLEPDNPGSAITDYDVRYREVTTPRPPGPTRCHTGTARTVTLTGLTAGATYEVQVRATNAEGTGEWSPSARSPSTANSAPVFGQASYSLHPGRERRRQHDRHRAGHRVGDRRGRRNPLSFYAIEAGNTGNVFAIGLQTGVITYTGSGEDFESFTDPGQRLHADRARLPKRRTHQSPTPP